MIMFIDDQLISTDDEFFRYLQINRRPCLAAKHETSVSRASAETKDDLLEAPIWCSPWADHRYRSSLHGTENMMNNYRYHEYHEYLNIDP